MRSIYPKALEDRLTPSHPAMVTIRAQYLPVLAKNFILLQILFMSLFCWVFGSLYLHTSHTHNLNIAFVDYDGGSIGEAFRTAYAGLRSDAYPELVERSPADFNTPADLDGAVCRAEFWASIYIAPGASDRLSSALAGNSSAAAYDKTNVVSYTWNEARYPTVVDAAIASNLGTLSAAAKIAFATRNAAQGVVNATDPAVISVLVEPWQLMSTNIQPTTQGSRAIYNTLTIVLILIQEFFYLGTINGIYGQLKIWNKGHPIAIIIIRFISSASYTLVGALCTSGAIWAFRSGWNLDGVQFVLNWLTLWLFAHLNFQVLDVFSIWLPTPYVPMSLIAWVMVNVAAIMLPFELSPGFFQIGYAFPSHAVYQVLVDIWSRGCNPVLASALPTLVAWELVSTVLSALGVYRRCHYAKLAGEREEMQFNERVNAAVEFERTRQSKLREKAREEQAAKEDEPITTESSRDEAGDEETRDELARVITQVNSKIRQEKRRASAAAPHGPSFDLPFDCGDDADE